ncbi:hypothetical protein PF003_g4962 [Phytophthora fragariae]|nr:hypothetical protein PF003_g4962 [Phytophthora fragariae]
MGTTASSKLGPATKVSRAVRAACMGCLLIVVQWFRFVCTKPSPASSGGSGKQYPRHHHRPRAWGRRHRASWGRHKVSPCVRRCMHGPAY